MRFAIITFSTKLCILRPPRYSPGIPFKDVSGWQSLRNNVVRYAKRPAKPQDDIGHEFDDKLWSLIEECWSQEPCNRPTAKTVSLRLEERRELELKELDEEGNLRKQVEKNAEERIKSTRQDLETDLSRQKLEQAELKKELDEERLLRKQLERDVQVESPPIPNGTYIIKNRTRDIYWYGNGWPCLKAVKYSKNFNSLVIKVNEHSSIIQVLIG